MRNLINELISEYSITKNTSVFQIAKFIRMEATTSSKWERLTELNAMSDLVADVKRAVKTTNPLSRNLTRVRANGVFAPRIKNVTIKYADKDVIEAMIRQDKRGMWRCNVTIGKPDSAEHDIYRKKFDRYSDANYFVTSVKQDRSCIVSYIERKYNGFVWSSLS